MLEAGSNRSSCIIDGNQLANPEYAYNVVTASTLGYLQNERKSDTLVVVVGPCRKIINRNGRVLRDYIAKWDGTPD